MKPRHPTTMENLPSEVLSDLFIRLLAKEVAQMRCVSKSWNALLSQSSFVKSHIHRSSQNKDEILLFFGTLYSFDRNTFTARLSRSPHLELTNSIKPPVIPGRKYKFGLLIGSVNGLICFCYKSSRDGTVIHIWNPSLSALLTLPPCPVIHHFDFGFGYGPKTLDYKVVKLGRFYRGPYMVPQALVYSMRKGLWESISQSFPSHIRFLEGRNNQVCVDDNLHWLCGTGLDRKGETILAFDLGVETFSEIPLPDSLLHHLEDRSNVLGVLSGKICVMSCVNGGECEVWVMDDYGVSDSWVKHQVFPPFSGDIIPCGFTSRNEFLFQVDIEDDRFGLYDPIAAKIKTFKIMSKYSSIMRFSGVC